MSLESRTLCGVTIHIQDREPRRLSRLLSLWQRLFVLKEGVGLADQPRLCFDFCSEHAAYPSVPHRPDHQESGLAVVRTPDGFCLAVEHAHLDLNLARSTATGTIREPFWEGPFCDQRDLFLLAFVILLRPHGYYGLHANGVIWPQDPGRRSWLIVGSSGTGKTTLTLALVSQGWCYLCDDALLLQTTADGVTALALRRDFSCTEQTLRRMPHVVHTGPIVPLPRDKQVVDLIQTYPDQHRQKSIPSLLLFPEIGQERYSRLTPVDDTRAMVALMAQSPGIFVDRQAVTGQMNTLKQLVHQTRGYQLVLGQDIFGEPARLSDMLASVE